MLKNNAENNWLINKSKCGQTKKNPKLNAQRKNLEFHFENVFDIKSLQVKMMNGKQNKKRKILKKGRRREKKEGRGMMCWKKDEKMKENKSVQQKQKDYLK